MVRASSSRSLAETSGIWCKKAQEEGSYKAERRIQRASQKCRFVRPMQDGGALGRPANSTNNPAAPPGALRQQVPNSESDVAVLPVLG